MKKIADTFFSSSSSTGEDVWLFATIQIHNFLTMVSRMYLNDVFDIWETRVGYSIDDSRIPIRNHTQSDFGNNKIIWRGFKTFHSFL